MLDIKLNEEQPIEIDNRLKTILTEKGVEFKTIKILLKGY